MTPDNAPTPDRNTSPAATATNARTDGERAGDSGGADNGRAGGGRGADDGRAGDGGTGDGGSGDGESAAAELLSGLALASFRLNGQFLHVAEELAKPAGMTAAWWQVLGAVLGEPLPVAGIARVMGMTRQGVQRIADLLVERGLAEYRPNPAHRRAKLLQPTEAGREAIARIVPGHRAFAARLVETLGLDATRDSLTALHRLTTALNHLTDA